VTTLSPELDRLGAAIRSLGLLREVFAQMEHDGERARAWDYLRSRFGEFEEAEMPAFECVDD
jgi:hypothetical protein